MINTDEKIKCQFCNRIVNRVDAVKYTDGSFACETCSEQLQEYTMDCCSTLLEGEDDED